MIRKTILILSTLALSAALGLTDFTSVSPRSRDGDPPEPFIVTIRYDWYGKPDGTYWSDRLTDVTDTDTGSDYANYDIWQSRILLRESESIHIEAGTPFWLEIYFTGPSFGWTAREWGNVHIDWEEYPWSALFRVLGTPDAGVEDSSWGEIKATF